MNNLEPTNQALQKLKLLTEFVSMSRGIGTTTVQLLGIDGDYECIFVHDGQPERHYVTGILGTEIKRLKFIDINQAPERIDQMLRGRKCPMIIDHGVWSNLTRQMIQHIESLEQQVKTLTTNS